jgi:hypothetical protein
METIKAYDIAKSLVDNLHEMESDGEELSHRQNITDMAQR